MYARAGSMVGFGPGGGPPNTLTGSLGTDNTMHASSGGLDTVSQLIPGLSSRMASSVGTFLQGLGAGGGAAAITTPRGGGMRHTDRPTEAGSDINIKLKLKALRNDAQQSYSEGTHLFLHKSELDVDEESHMTFSLAVLNDMLERAKRQEQMHKASIGSFALAGRKRGHDSELDFDGGDGGSNDPSLLVAKFPLTVAEFARDISYVGPVLTIMSTLPPADVFVTQKLVGRQRTCKLWRDLHQGDGLGFVAKQFEQAGGSYQYDYRGTAVDSGTPGPFLQVRPISLRETRSPIFCTEHLKPDEEDLLCLEETVTRRKIQPTRSDTSRLLDFEGTPSVEEMPLVTQELREGIFMPCGVVFINDRPDPTDEELDMALRSQPAYDELASRCSLDIYYQVGTNLNHTLFPQRASE